MMKREIWTGLATNGLVGTRRHTFSGGVSYVVTILKDTVMIYSV